MLVLFFAFRLLWQQAGGPKLPGDIEKIGSTREFQHHEGFLKGLRDEGQPQDHTGQVNHVAQHQPETHEEGFPKA